MIDTDHSLRTVSDRVLLKRVSRSDVAAFNALYDRHVVSAHALAGRIVGWTSLADDVCQEAFIAVWRSAGSYDPALGEPRAWLLSIVRNRAVDQRRRRNRLAERESWDDTAIDRQPAPAATATEVAALRQIDAHRTRDLLDVLSYEQREVIELAFFVGCTHIEIAERLRMPLGTVKGRISRGLARMRTELAT
ncbi:RNA polymerase sigma factor [Patulibacter minatonensis]|uniref:RNA polymerase sigma factor n=1 Tax=Patulibacter minatonensis TaxID=298163 RepID=UPI00047E35B4|nr:sigma-70 family RNA polymerase sigma factor [Patulibacter minatonensis]